MASRKTGQEFRAEAGLEVKMGARGGRTEYWPPKDAHALTPGPHKYAFHSKGEGITVADGIKCVNQLTLELKEIIQSYPDEPNVTTWSLNGEDEGRRVRIREKAV